MYQNIHTSSFFMFLAATRTYGFWLDMICVFYIACVIIFLLFITRGKLLEIRRLEHIKTILNIIKINAEPFYITTMKSLSVHLEDN